MTNMTDRMPELFYIADSGNITVESNATDNVTEFSYCVQKTSDDLRNKLHSI